MLQHSVNALEACVVPGPRPPSCSILLSQQGISLRGRREGRAGGGRRDIRGPPSDPGCDPGFDLLIRGAGNQIKSGFCRLRFPYHVDHREMSAHPGHFLPVVGSLLQEASGVGSGRFFSSVPTPKRLASCPGSSCPSPGLQEVDSGPL